MNVSQLARNYLTLMPSETNGRFHATHRPNGTVSLRYAWDDDTQMKYPNSRSIGELDVDREGNIVKLHPNEHGPFGLVEALIQAYNTNE